MGSVDRSRSRGRGIGRTAETGRSRPPVGSPFEEYRREESSMTG